MTVKKVILYTLLLPLAVFILAFFTRDEWAFYISICWFIFWPVGIILGVFISVILRKPRREPYFYIAGQVIVVAGALAFTIHNQIKTRQQDNAVANNEENHGFMGLTDSTLSPGVNAQKGFLKLESQFSDPNSFRVHRFWTDTTVSSPEGNLSVIYYTYTKEDRLYFSRVRVSDGNATIEVLDGDVRSKEYVNINNKFEKWEKETLESMDRTIDSLPDSSRIMIRKEWGGRISDFRGRSN